MQTHFIVSCLDGESKPNDFAIMSYMRQAHKIVPIFFSFSVSQWLPTGRRAHCFGIIVPIEVEKVGGEATKFRWNENIHSHLFDEIHSFLNKWINTNVFVSNWRNKRV